MMRKFFGLRYLWAYRFGESQHVPDQEPLSTPERKVYLPDPKVLINAEIDTLLEHAITFDMAKKIRYMFEQDPKKFDAHLYAFYTETLRELSLVDNPKNYLEIKKNIEAIERLQKFMVLRILGKQ